MPLKFPLRNHTLLVACFFALVLVVAPVRSANVDQLSFASWGGVILKNGVATIYRDGTVNYGPLFVNILATFSYGLGSPDRVVAKIELLKWVVALFDFALILVVMRLLERRGQNPMLAFAIAFNPAFLYDTFLWGQIDIISTFFCFAALLFAITGKPTLSGIFTVLAFNIKPFALLYVPLLALLLLPSIVRNPRALIPMTIGMVVAQAYLVVLFWRTGEPWSFLTAYRNSLDWFPYISLNAFNLWYLVDRGRVLESPNTLLFSRFSYAQVGTLLFLVTCAVSLLPIASRSIVCALQRQKFTDRDMDLFLLSAGWLTAGFFFFNTQMHERYAYAAVVFWGIYAVLTGNYWLYVLLSLAYLLNVEMIFQVLLLERFGFGLLYDTRLVASLFLIALSWGLFTLYRRSHLWQDLRNIAQLSRERLGSTTQPSPASG